MTRLLTLLQLAVVLVLATSPARGAVQLRVITANPPEAGVHELAVRFGNETGQEVSVETMGTGALNRLLASDEAADVVIGTTASLDQAERDGELQGPRTPIGRVGIGVIVRSGAAVPDVATVDALREAALEADGVIYNTAGSGQYVDRMFIGLGIGPEVSEKSARPGNAEQTIERMVNGEGTEIGFGLLSEMSPHDGQEIQIVGRLPDELQNYSDFEGAVLARSARSDAAADFIQYLTSPGAREVFATHGVD